MIVARLQQKPGELKPEFLLVWESKNKKTDCVFDIGLTSTHPYKSAICHIQLTLASCVDCLNSVYNFILEDSAPNFCIHITF
jgi:hypothetical protein